MSSTGDAALDAAIASCATARNTNPLEALETAADAAPSSSLISGLETAGGWAAFVLFRALARRREIEGDAYLGALLERAPQPLLIHLVCAALGQVRPASVPDFAPEHAAGPRVLEVLARHLEASDPLVEYAFPAAHLLGREDLVGVMHAMATKMGPTSWPKLERTIELLCFVVPMTPPWVDLVRELLPRVLFLVWDAMMRRREIDSILYALTLPIDVPVAEFLAVLRRSAGPEAIEPLRALAAGRYAGSPMAKRISKVVKDLQTPREALPPLPSMGGVGTDGGPVILITESSLERWKGADGGPPTDYDEACGGPYRVRAIERDGTPVLVLPHQAVGFLKPDDGSAVWAVLEGTDEALDSVRGELRFRKTKLTLAVPSGRLWAHDASLAGDRREASLAFDLEAGTYQVSQAKVEEATVLRLSLLGRSK